MMENNNFRSIPTSLFLNGPKLSIVSNPQSITESAGVATFTGIATAIYEDPRFKLDGGSVDIRWYFDGQRILDSSVDPNSRATIVGFNSTTGTGSTIIISNLDGNDNGKLVYFEADYIPSAYSYPVGSDVIAGTARSTANAFNEPLVSAGATLTARPLIVITKQPRIVSSFYNVENTFTIEAETSPANIVDNRNLTYQWQIDGVDFVDGTSTISRTDADQSLSIGGLSESTTVSGSKTPTLRIKTDQSYDSIVRCIVSNPDTRNSPVISNEVSFFIREPRNILNIETYDNSSIATLSQIDLDKEEITLTYATHPGNSICVYAPEKDVKVQVGLYGGKGSDNGSRKGGNGGLSFLEVTMERNVEYVFTGLFPFVNTPFFYRKGQLIGAVGGGGNAGSGSNGGSGGGVNESGVKGDRNSGGTGGQVYSAGKLPANGIFGSRTSLQAESPDTKATNQSGGRAISCTKGVYWRAQGFSACQDIGQSKFRISDGTLVTNSAEITRGYKDGYNLIQTSGAAESANSGHGGSGATGGNGGTSTGGGGGGSGYTDGSVTVRASLTGGWNSTSKVTISLNAGLIFWEGTYDSGITFSNDRLSFTRPKDNTQFPLGKQTYTSLLPSGNIYFDVQIDGGYDGWNFTLNQQGTSEVGALVIYDADSITGYLGYFEHYKYYSGWYWRGVWTGVYLIDAGAVVEADGNNVTKFQFDYGNEIAAPATLTTGTYRMAINRNEKKLYMKRISPDESSVGSITLPFTGNLRMAVLSQGWPGTYPSFGARILNNGIIYNGSGGLY